MNGILTETFYIKTMGCQMNVYDSDYLAQRLMAMGMSPVDNAREADVVLLNTCTVRAKPEHKAATYIGRISQIKKRKPNLIFGVLGCLAQQEGPEILKRFPAIDFVAGPRQIQDVIDILTRVAKGERGIVATALKAPPPEAKILDGYYEGKVTAFITIMQGCDNFCTYCIVPYVRGREASRPPFEILEEARSLVDQGVKEITLLGQNVNSYRWATDGSYWDFPSLLREVSRIPGLKRLRFTTSHPKDVSPQLIACFGELDNLCPHIHLPFQAGSNRVLKMMNRKYTREEYLGLVDRLRQIRPDIALSSDVMVGFPGETKQDFEMTLDLIKTVEFDSLFSFKYSDRKGTLAASFEGKVPEEEKSERLCILQEIQKQITLKKNRALEGKTVEVLVEGRSAKGDKLSGRTPTNKIVNFRPESKILGNIVKVKINKAYQNSLLGELLR
ncbi:MAG TPA: tRNA (N6-isopentenyl adenosine(37)-C2)-methylthiotransferase MiaB [Desulfobacterales bacterium]|nr:tRNA (N6-isopentenyl adenosine(37)-C2)-methylthiotransferase MiaB [Desulfobacterales bacterium]